ncbi:MAG: BREX system ATP-binding domain-containing protein [Acetobacteraceae bacterium]
MDVLTTPKLPLAEWLSLVERDYLAAFLPAGGAAVKFAILDAGGAGTVAEHLLRLGRQHAMLTVEVDAGLTRIHLMQDLFVAITRALPWDSLVQRYLEALFAAHDYAWPRPGSAMAIPDLAAAFAVAPNLLAHRVDRWLTADLWEDRRLAQDFRAALLALCLSHLDGTGWEAAGPVAQWLRGEKVPPAALHAADITARLSRTNARAMLASLCHFLRKAGTAGLLVVLDARRLSSGAAAEGMFRYSPAAVMDAYEVLREIIDDTERLPGLFLAVLADPELATGDPRRALSQYAALQMRVWPDVRPGDRQNPMAPLVWLAP